MHYYIISHCKSSFMLVRTEPIVIVYHHRFHLQSAATVIHLLPYVLSPSLAHSSPSQYSSSLTHLNSPPPLPVASPLLLLSPQPTLPSSSPHPTTASPPILLLPAITVDHPILLPVSPPHPPCRRLLSLPSPPPLLSAAAGSRARRGVAPKQQYLLIFCYVKRASTMVLDPAVIPLITVELNPISSKTTVVLILNRW